MKSLSGPNLTVWLILANVFVWGRVVAFDFTWDDHPSVATNASLRAWGTAIRGFGTDFWALHDRPAASGYYRPFVTLANVVLGKTLGFAPAVFHALSLGLHTANVLLARALLMAWGLTGGSLAAVLFVFALHPLQAEAVGFVSAQPDLWMAAFGLAFLAVASRPGRARFVAPLLFAGAIFSKETALALLPAYAAIAWRRRFPRRGWEVAGLVAVLALWTVLRHRALDAGAPPHLFDSGGPLRALRFLFAYPAAALAPVGIGPVRAAPPAWMVFGGVAFVLGGTAVVRRAPEAGRRWILRGALLFACFWLPVSGLVELRGGWADRYFYLSLLGLAVAFTAVAREVAGLRSFDPRPLAAIVIAVLAGWSAWAVGAWRSDGALWARAVRANPASSTAWNQHGVVLLGRGEVAPARAAFARALTLDGADVDARANEVVAALRAEDVAGAIESAERLRALAPADPRGYDLGASAAAAAGDLAAAQALQAGAIARAPTDWRLRANAGALEARLGLPERAVASWRAGLALAPDAASRSALHARIAGTLVAEARWEEARAATAAWLSDDPASVDARRESDKVARILAIVGE